MTALRHMRPSFSADNLAYGRTGGTKHIGQLQLGITASRIEMPNLCDLALGKVGAPVFFAIPARCTQDMYGMEGVLAMCHPFQVIRSIVRFVAVLMVHLKAIRDRTMKGSADKGMNRVGRLLAMLIQRHMLI